MRTLTTISRPAAVLLLSFLLLGMDGPPRVEGEERQLEEKRVQLAARIAALKQEQDFLLFQRTIAGSDSKYLVLDVPTGTGTLNYRNRILRSFGFTLSGAKPQKIRKGRHVLTGKADGPSSKRSLLVEDSFIIHGKKYAENKAGNIRLPGLVVDRKDLAAIYFAVEKGAMLYVIR